MNEPDSSLDTVFGVLANRRRRYVLYYLLEADPVLTVEDIAERVETWEREWDTAGGGETEGGRRTVRIDLHHNHLPRLADAGLLDYDARTETVRAWERPSLERWVGDGDQELPRLRALLGVDDAGDPD